MRVSLKDQSVIVIGASSGIGRSAAVLFAREGAKVLASARREERLLELQKEMAGEGHAIEIFPASVTEPPEMAALAQRAHDKFGGVDILVYVSGTNTKDRALTRLTPLVWDELVDVNLNGAFYATYAVLPGMRAKKSGHLIYVSSISGHTPDVSGAAYQASKRGAIGLAHAIRVEEKENGIRTCAICPGLVDTEILEKRPVKPGAETLAKALQAEDVAESILAVALMPPRVTITELSIVPTLI